MKAMILAAGMGTRLKPYTDKMPKALVPVNEKPLLEYVIGRLVASGYDEIIINIHHFGKQIRDFIRKNHSFGVKIKFSDERNHLLDTGGGLKKASSFFNKSEPFLIHNVDIISDINFDELRESHKFSGALVTLAVRNRETSRYFLFDETKRLRGWMNMETGETKYCIRKKPDLFPLAFSGIHIVDAAIFDLMKETGKFSLTDVYLRLAKDHLIRGFVHDSDYWSDVGKPEELEKTRLWLKENSI
jgi:N-acetyl-alpha-D-muramate 1-phosphate uridylyltransferase